MLVRFLPVLQGVGAIVFGLVVSSNFVVQIVIKLHRTIAPFIPKDKYISFIKTYLKVARIFFLVGGIIEIVIGVINLPTLN